MRWLHISDLHFGFGKKDGYRSPKGYEPNEISSMRESLLSKLAPQIKPIDCLFITGDLRFARDCGKDYPPETAEYVRELREALGVAQQDVFVVQGNHDVNRRSKLLKPTLDSLEYQTHDGRIDDDVLELIDKQRKPFVKLYKEICGTPEPKGYHYCRTSHGYNILCLNTALFSYTKDEDGKLILGSHLIDALFQQIQDKSRPAVILAHHELSCLRPDEENKFKNKLKELSPSHSDVLYLCGHTHQAKPKAERIGEGEDSVALRTFICGAQVNRDPILSKPDIVVLVGETGGSNGADYVQAYHWVYRVLDWLPDQTFSYHQNKALDGKWYFPERPLSETPVTALERQYKDRILRQCEYIELPGFSQGEEYLRRVFMSRLFVEPYFRVSTLKEELKRRENAFDDSTPGSSTIADLMKGSVIRVFAHSQAGGGKSTLLKWIACAYAMRKNEQGDDAKRLGKEGLFPIWIRCPDMDSGAKGGVNWIEKAIQDSLPPDTIGLMSQIERHIQLGSALLLLDGADEIGDSSRQAELLRHLAQFIRANEKANVIVAMRSAGLEILGSASKNDESASFTKEERQIFRTFSCFEIEPLRQDDSRKQIEELCNKWWTVSQRFPLDEEYRQARLREITDSRLAELSQNPLLLTTLLMVQSRYRKLPASRPALLSSAMDAMLESSQKTGALYAENPDEVLRLLSYLSFEMSVRQSPWVTEEQLRRYLDEMRARRPELLPDGWTEDSFRLFLRNLTNDSVIMQSYLPAHEGTEMPQKRFAFRYKPFCEYLTALAAVECYYPQYNENDSPGDALSRYFHQSGLIRELSDVISLTAGMSVSCAHGMARAAEKALMGDPLSSLSKVYVRKLALRFLAKDARLGSQAARRLLRGCFKDRLMYGDIEALKRIAQGRYRDLLCERFQEIGDEKYGDAEYYMPLLELLSGHATPYRNYQEHRQTETRKASVAMLADVFWMRSREEGEPYDIDWSEETQKELVKDLLRIAERHSDFQTRWHALRALKWRLRTKEGWELLQKKDDAAFLSAIVGVLVLTDSDTFPPVTFNTLADVVERIAREPDTSARLPKLSFSDALERFCASYERKALWDDIRMEYPDLLSLSLLTAAFHENTDCLNRLLLLAERWRDIIWENWGEPYRKIQERHFKLAPTLKALVLDNDAYADAHEIVRTHLQRMDFAILRYLYADKADDAKRFLREELESNQRTLSYFKAMYPEVFNDCAGLYEQLRKDSADAPVK